MSSVLVTDSTNAAVVGVSRQLLLGAAGAFRGHVDAVTPARLTTMEIGSVNSG